MADGADAGEYREYPAFSVEAAGHRFEFHLGGRGRLQALLDLMDQAREQLQLCFYMFSDDEAGAAVRAALINALNRGVKATLIVDGWGTGASREFFTPFTDAGGCLREFSPRWGRAYLIRNHQKLAIADGAKALLGGFNIDDDYFAPPEENGWNDIAMTLTGPAVARLCLWYEWLEQWVGSSRGGWLALRRKLRSWDPGAGEVRVVLGGPARGITTWVRSLARDLEGASRLAVMIAYFSPSRGILRRMRAIAARGNAMFLLPSKSDNTTTIAASRLLYRRLLKAGAKICEFLPCKMHAKLVVVDDVLYIGSANLDMRSLFINLEVMLRIEDKALADRIAEHIDAHCKFAQTITPGVYAKLATPWNRLRWFVSYLLVGVLDYTISRRLNLRS